MADGTLRVATEHVNDSSADDPPRKAFVAYHAQRRAAKRRGIAWEFTLEEWWAWWQRDGNWKCRGREKDQIVMARFGDAGAYRPNNVFAATPRQNLSDRALVDLLKRAEAAKRHWSARTPEQNASLPIFQKGEAHPRARPVLTPAGRFGNAREAAEYYGIDPSNASKRALRRRCGWIYEDEASQAAG